MSNRKIRLLTLCSLWSYGIGESLFNFMTAFVVEWWTPSAIGAGRFVNHSLTACSFFFAGYIIARYGALRSLIAANIFSRSVVIIAALFACYYSPFLLMFSSIGFGITMNAFAQIFQSEFTDQQRATLGSLTSVGNALGLGVIGVGVGYLGDHFEPRTVILLGEFLVLPLLLIYRRELRKS